MLDVSLPACKNGGIYFSMPGSYASKSLVSEPGVIKEFLKFF